MRKTVLSLVVCAIGVLLVLSVTFTVDETEHVIVLRFGDPRRVISNAGLHLKWPAPIDEVRRIDRRLRVLDPEADEVLTSDKKNILVNSFLAWSVADPTRFLVTVTDHRGAESRLIAILRSEVGTTLGSYPLTALINDDPAEGGHMAEVTAKITAQAAAYAKEKFGIHIATVRFKRINFPPDNKISVQSRMRAERMRIAKGYRSEGEEEKAKIIAKADRERAALLAEANRKAEVRRGEADAEATRIYAEAFSKDPGFYEFIRSLRAYREIIGEGSTLVIPADSPLLKVLRDPEKYIRSPGKGDQTE